jgi:hypothetical protein
MIILFQIGFGTFSQAFAAHMVDGDLLLLLTEKELEDDLGMHSGLLRKRFMRELESLKIAADYGYVYSLFKFFKKEKCNR